MKALLFALAFLSAPLAWGAVSPVSLSEVGLVLDVDSGSKLLGTGKLVLKDQLPDTPAKSMTAEGAAVKVDLRCEIPLRVAVPKGKAELESALVGAEGLVVPLETRPGSVHLSLGYFSLKTKQAEPLRGGKLSDFYGEFSVRKDAVLEGKEPAGRVVFANRQHAAFAMPTKKPGALDVKITIEAAEKSSPNQLCQRIQKHGFTVRSDQK